MHLPSDGKILILIIVYYLTCKIQNGQLKVKGRFNTNMDVNMSYWVAPNSIADILALSLCEYLCKA